jgi:hypothetical protein
MSCDIIMKVNVEHTNYSWVNNEINSKYWNIFYKQKVWTTILLWAWFMSILKSIKHWGVKNQIVKDYYKFIDIFNMNLSNWKLCGKLTKR